MESHFLLSLCQICTDSLQVKHDVKAKLTMQASGNAGGEGARTHIQGKHHVAYFHFIIGIIY